MLLHSFGSVLTFEAGTVVTAASGDPGFTASGNAAMGQAPPDVDGTLRLSGVFSSITFTAVVNLSDQSISDGIYLQIGAARPWKRCLTGGRPSSSPGSPAVSPGAMVKASYALCKVSINLCSAR